MDVLVLIDRLDDLVHNAKPVPLTNEVRVDKDELYELLDQIRATIPGGREQGRAQPRGAPADPFGRESEGRAQKRRGWRGLGGRR